MIWYITALFNTLIIYVNSYEGYFYRYFKDLQTICHLWYAYIVLDITLASIIHNKLFMKLSSLLDPITWLTENENMIW